MADLAKSVENMPLLATPWRKEALRQPVNLPMSEEPPKRFVRFTQAEIKRAAKGMTDAGRQDFKIEIEPNGKIVIQAGSGAASPSGSSWDDV